jgi:hypothetical protein
MLWLTMVISRAQHVRRPLAHRVARIPREPRVCCPAGRAIAGFLASFALIFPGSAFVAVQTMPG